MRIITNTVLLLLIITISSCKKEQRVEEDILDCTYAAFEDSGQSLKNLMIDYEQTIINDGILKGTSGSDYLHLLERLSQGDLEDFVASASFINEVQKLGKPNPDIISECQNNIFQDTERYNTSKILLLDNTLMVNDQAGDLDPILIAKTTAEILNKEDLELSFYKMRVFLLMDLMLTNKGIYNLELGKEN